MTAPQDMSGVVIAGDRQVPQAELMARAQRVAAGLVALGLKPGDSVAGIMRNDVALLEIMLGANIAGVYFAPVNWHATADEAAHILRDSGAGLVVIHSDLLTQFGAALPEGVAVREVPTPPEIVAAYGLTPPGPAQYPLWDGWRDGFAPYDGPPSAPRANIIYTSGTTGNPKGVIREPAVGPIADRVADVVGHAYGIIPGETIRTAVTGPLYHSAPNVYTTHAVRAPGSLVILQPRFDAEGLLALIERYRLTHLHLVPTMFVRLLALPREVRERYDLSSLRFVVHGAAPCPVEVRRQMIEWFGPVIAEYYGATETGAAVVMRPEDALAHAEAVGRPSPWTRIEIVREDGTLCDTGETGEIYMKIDGFPSFEYRNQPGRADQNRRGDLVSVGDIGFLDAEGFLHLCDRKGDMIISGGVNIYPADIESALIDVPGVRDAAVFGLPDPEFGECIAACVATDLTEAELRAELGQRLAKFKIPRVFEILPALPREDSGKIRKRLLKRGLLDRMEAAQAG